jgi:hypothetical protein
MASTRVDIGSAEWRPGSPLYGATSIYEGRELVELKLLSDRRAEGGGIAFLARFMPPAGKLIKIVAVARSDEHAVTLEGGRSTKTGQPLRVVGDYLLNPQGQPHSAFIATETTALLVYAGEPDEIRSIEVLDSKPRS